MTYATLDDAKQDMRTDSALDTSINETILYSCLLQATARLDRLSKATLQQATFEPYTRTYRLTIERDKVNSYDRLFMLPFPLLSLSAVTVYNSALTVGTDVEMYPQGIYPVGALRLTSSCGNWYTTYYNSDYPRHVVVTGEWGYHSDYAYAWQDEDTVQDAGGINATVTTITVADVDGTNYRNLTPRFSAGHLIRIDDEYLRVTDTDTALNTLTVQRGINGTTAAIHAKDATISVYNPDDNIKRLVARHAGMLYKRRGAYDEPQGNLGGLAYPRDLLEEMRGILDGYVIPVAWL